LDTNKLFTVDAHGPFTMAEIKKENEEVNLIIGDDPAEVEWLEYIIERMESLEVGEWFTDGAEVKRVR
jgi:hypothetical protein